MNTKKLTLLAVLILGNAALLGMDPQAVINLKKIELERSCEKYMHLLQQYRNLLLKRAVLRMELVQRGYESPPVEAGEQAAQELVRFVYVRPHLDLMGQEKALRGVAEKSEELNNALFSQEVVHNIPMPTPEQLVQAVQDLRQQILEEMAEGLRINSGTGVANMDSSPSSQADPSSSFQAKTEAEESDPEDDPSPAEEMAARALVHCYFPKDTTQPRSQSVQFARRHMDSSSSSK